MKRRKEHQRRAEPEPPVHVLAPFVEALAESDQREQVEQGERGERSGEQTRSVGVRIEGGQRRCG